MQGKQLYKKWLITFTLFALVAFVYAVWNPDGNRYFPKCVFLQLTGWQCPGCGTQRAVHQLLHGNWAMAVHYNTFFVLSIPWMLTLLVAHFSKTERKEKLNRIILHRNVVKAYLLFFVCWWIYRNIV